jgi:hypothetical protein
MKNSLVILALALTAGCAHSIHEVHVSDFVPMAQIESGEMVKAQTEQFVVMGFVGQTDYVDQAKAQLMANCPGGAVTGITTQFSTSMGFLSWTNKILMQGLCVKN